MRSSSRSLLLPLLATGGVLFFYGVLLASTKNLAALDDGIRHMVMAKGLYESGILDAPGWSAFLYHGFLHETTFDPWLFAEVLMIPFTALSLVPAVKVFTFASIAFLLACFAFVLRSMKLKSEMTALFLLLLPFGNALFGYRLLLGRPFTITTGMFLLTIWALLERRFLALFFLMFAATLFSHLFIFPFGIAVAAGTAFFFRREHASGVRCALAGTLGTALGLVLHPPGTLAYLHYLSAALLRLPFFRSLPLGSELWSGLLSDSRPLTASLGFLAMVALIYGSTHGMHVFRRSPLSFLLPSIIVLTAGYLSWVRVIDLLWPLTLISIAWLIAQDPLIFKKIRDRFLPARPRFRARSALALVLLYCITNAAFLGWSAMEKDATFDLKQYETIQSLPAGSHMLNVDWDAFPALLAMRQDLTYATGMDPGFTHLEDPEAARLLTMLGSDAFRFPESIISPDLWLEALLRRIPGAYLVVLRNRHGKFLQALHAVPRLTALSSSGALAIFKIEPL